MHPKIPSLHTLLITLLIACTVFLVIAHVYWGKTLGFFDLDKEGSLKAVFSGFQLLISGFCAGFIGYLSFRLRASRPFVILWSSISGLFFYLALDDMMMIHERVGFVLNRWSGLHGAYEGFNWLLYFLPFMVLGTIVFFLAVRSLSTIDRRTRMYAIVGLTGFLLTLVAEAVGGQLLKGGEIQIYKIGIIVEESLLLFGETFFLLALLRGAISLFSKAYTPAQKNEHDTVTIRSLVQIKKDGVVAFFLRWTTIGIRFVLITTMVFACFALMVPLLSVIEKSFHVTLPYEAVIRLSIFFAFTTLLLGSLPWVYTHGMRRHQTLWAVLAVSFFFLVIILFGDRHSRLMEEFSWIRYATAAFLGAASMGAAYQVIQSWKRHLYALGGVWLTLAVGFLFGGIDEIFQVHEWLGALIERSQHWPHVVSDLITVGYATGGLAILISFFILFRRHYGEHLFSLGVFLVGGGSYFISTMFDTLDGVATGFLKHSAIALSSQPQFIFNDWFSLLWSPHNFFNSLEEVLEYVSATLFFAAIMILILEQNTTRQYHMKSILSPVLMRSFCVFVAVCAGLGILSGTVVGARMKISDAAVTQRIAGPMDGLHHADDLFYHPRWGLIMGNEGGGSVLVWKDGNMRTLPDPTHSVIDTDSVTATDSAVYASSGARGAIVRYQEGKGWKDIWTRKDGLDHPEALVVVNDVVYVVDESRMSVMKLKEGAKPVEWRPEHPDWHSPEGIAYDPLHKTLIVTDDTSGAVFSLVFGLSIKKIAQLTYAEDVAMSKRGTYLVTDNGSGSIHELSSDGKQIDTIQFSRAYRDLQGVATDGDALYVVTSDGYGQGSFMPSFLFKVLR